MFVTNFLVPFASRIQFITWTNYGIYLCSIIFIPVLRPTEHSAQWVLRKFFLKISGRVVKMTACIYCCGLQWLHFPYAFMCTGRILIFIFFIGGTRWLSWLKHCATSRKVGCSIPDGVIGIFHWHNSSGCTMALGLNQPLTEMSTRNISWGGKSGRCVGLTIPALSSADCLEIWEPQPPGTLRACPGLSWDYFTLLSLLLLRYLRYNWHSNHDYNLHFWIRVSTIQKLYPLERHTTLRCTEAGKVWKF